MTIGTAHLRESPSQTAGPYVHLGLVPNLAGLGGPWAEDLGARVIEDGARGERASVTGRITDGLGVAVGDAIVEVWQADANGRFRGEEGADPSCRGFGRASCDGDGRFRFDTVRPGPVPWTDGTPQAPHLTLWIVARGINVGLHTRLYFADDPRNEADPLLSRIQPALRRDTLIARETDGAWHLPIRLQGEGETVFLDM